MKIEIHMKKTLLLAILLGMATLVSFAGSRKSGVFTLIINGEQADYKGDYIFVNGVNLPDGSGKLTYLNGNTFSGKFIQGKIEGKGTFKYKDGTVYSGEFQDNLRQGKGTLTHKDGTKYVGQFVNDEMEGKGTLTLSNGTKYVGEFKAGKRHGRGVQTDKAGNKYEGEFINDVPAPAAGK